MAEDELESRAPFEGEEEPVPEGSGRPMARIQEKLARLTPTVAGNTNVSNLIWSALQFARTAPADASGDGWTPLGPRNVGGSVRCLEQDPVMLSTFYAGTAEGGLWRTQDQGHNWVPLGETDLGIGPIGCIAVAPGNNAVVIVGTGDRIPGNAAGVGLFRSTDANLASPTFTRIATGDESSATPGAAFRYSRIVVDPTDSTRFWVASSSGLWRFEGTPTTIHAEPLTYVGGNKMVTDVALAVDPTNANRLWLLAAVHRQGVQRGVYDRTAAAGTHAVWSASAGVPPPVPNAPAPAPANAVGRIRLAFAPSNANIAYVLAEDAAPPTTHESGYPLPLLRSTDGGANFAYVPAGGTVNWMAPPPAPTPPPNGPLPGIAWYALELAVHPGNPAVVAAGNVDLFRTNDSGGTWTKLIDWTNYMNHDRRAQHADMHAVQFDRCERRSSNPLRLWVGNDGGVSYTEDRGITWRKRSYGILGAQFIDLTTHPAYPFIFGGGMQDNGTFLSYGGPTWYRMGGGDGGAMAMHPTDPRRFLITHQNNLESATVGTGPDLTPLREVPHAAGTPDVQMQVTSAAIDTTLAANAQLFRGLVRADPTNATRYLLGRVGAAFVTTTSGTAWTPLTTPAYTGGAGTQTSALEMGPGAAAATDIYVGTSAGDVFATGNSGANWAQTSPFGAWAFISAFAIHPAHPEVVAVAAYAAGGSVMLSHNRGTTWTNITGVNKLPAGGVASLAFHPTDERVLFAGTLVGVFVARDLPAYSVGVALPAAPPLNPSWRIFNRGLGPMLVNDLEVVPEARTLRCATFARGCFEASIQGAVATGAPADYFTPQGYRVPPVKLCIRNHFMDDGRTYPPANSLTSDPRLPTTAGNTHLDGTQSIDIKVNSPDFVDSERRFLQSEAYGNLPDGSELDEEFVSEQPLAGDVNRVYVQVHNRGHTAAANVEVSLYYADAGEPVAIPPLVTADLNFPNAPTAASKWQRAGPAQVVPSLLPGQPTVVRFNWDCPLSLRTNVALLAVCHQPAADPLEAPLSGDTRLYVVARRQAALRVTPVSVARRTVYIRDGLDDFGKRGTVAWGGRSPDLLVLRRAAADAIPAADLHSPTGPLGNLMDPRRGDRIRPGNDNAIFVRVHNPHGVKVHVDVELYQATLNTPTQAGSWTKIGATTRVPDLDPASWKVARFDLTGADPAPTNAEPWAKAYILAALCRAVDPSNGTELGPIPDINTVAGPDAFWLFFTRRDQATNAALRALRFEAAP